MLSNRNIRPGGLNSFGRLTMLALIAAVPTVAVANRLVDRESATRYGLRRAWFSQVSLDRTRSRVLQWTLDGEQLFALTNSGTLQALHAETGKTQWIKRAGAPDGIFSGPAVNSKYVALINGSKLYVMDRHDGHLIFSRSLGSAPAVAPALSEDYAFVGLINGRIEGYHLHDPTKGVWTYHSSGRIFQPPVVADQLLSWSTDRGYFYVGFAKQPRVMFRVETNDELVAASAERNSLFYVASRNGSLVCLEKEFGGEHWRYYTGHPIAGKPVVVERLVYVASDEPALHAVDAETGQLKWVVRGVASFVAQGPKHTYGLDRAGNLLILEKETGGIVGQQPISEGAQAIVNEQSDRIYLVHTTGLVQCLYETAATQPTYYRKKSGKETTPDEQDAPDSPFVEEEAEATAPKIVQPDKSPFSPDTDEDTTADDDNPFF